MKILTIILTILLYTKYVSSNTLFDTSFYDVNFVSNNIENSKIIKINEMTHQLTNLPLTITHLLSEGIERKELVSQLLTQLSPSDRSNLPNRVIRPRSPQVCPCSDVNENCITKWSGFLKDGWPPTT